jgi:hypoxanthine phosphoribosyltransferase
MEMRMTPLFSAASIQQRVVELARRISDDFADKPLCMMAVLKGAIVFAADLMRELTIPVTLDFIGASSYAGTSSSGNVIFTTMPRGPLAGQNILLVEDILDTGCTAVSILERLRQEEPASLAICTLLDKPCRRKVPVNADYIGFTIDDQFVIGYGLDYEERGRELPDIHVLDAQRRDAGDI